MSLYQNSQKIQLRAREENINLHLQNAWKNKKSSAIPGYFQGDSGPVQSFQNSKANVNVYEFFHPQLGPRWLIKWNVRLGGRSSPNYSPIGNTIARRIPLGAPSLDRVVFQPFGHIQYRINGVIAVFTSRASTIILRDGSFAEFDIGERYSWSARRRIVAKQDKSKHEPRRVERR